MDSPGSEYFKSNPGFFQFIHKVNGILRSKVKYIVSKIFVKSGFMFSINLGRPVIMVMVGFYPEIRFDTLSDTCLNGFKPVSPDTCRFSITADQFKSFHDLVKLAL